MYTQTADGQKMPSRMQASVETAGQIAAPATVQAAGALPLTGLQRSAGQRWRRRAWQLLGLLAMLLVLGGCAVRLAYPRLDTLVRWELDDYLDPDKAQTGWLKERLALLLDWHRREELPQYLSALDSLRADISGRNLDLARVEAHRAAIARAWDALVQQVRPEAEALVMRLDERQVRHLLTKLDEANREEDEEYAEWAALDADERADKRYERWEDRLSDFVGRLSDEQQAMIRAFTDQHPDLHAGRMASRQTWRMELEELLARRSDPQAVAVRVGALFDAGKWRTPEYNAAMAAERHRQDRFYVAFAATLSERQRARFLETLADWREDLLAVSE